MKTCHWIKLIPLLLLALIASCGADNRPSHSASAADSEPSPALQAEGIRFELPMADGRQVSILAGSAAADATHRQWTLSQVDLLLRLGDDRLSADRASWDMASGAVLLTGRVKARFGTLAIEAGQVRLDLSKSNWEAQTDLHARAPGMDLRAVGLKGRLDGSGPLSMEQVSLSIKMTADTEPEP